MTTMTKCVAAALTLVACSSEPNGVRGTSIIVHVDEDGVSESAQDLVAAPPRLFVQSDDLSFVEHEVSVTDDDAFEVPDAPGGTYTIVFDGFGLVSDERELDLGYDLLGRARLEPGLGLTELYVGLNGLQPWVDGDRLALYSAGPGASMWIAGYDDFLGAGDTSYGAFIPYDTLGYTLINQSLGDEVYVGQLPASLFDGAAALTLERGLYVDSLTMAPGAATPLEGGLSAVDSRSLIDIDWDVAAFEQHFAAIRADAEPLFQHTLVIDALPQAAARGPYGAGLELAALFPAGGQDARVSGTLEYGDPPEVGGDRIVGALAGARVFFQAPGGQQIQYRGYVAVWDTVDAIDGRTLRPSIAPPRNLSVDGQAADVDLLGVGVTPTVSWDAPAEGTPDYYTVAIYLVPQRYESPPVPIFWIQTVARTVTVPPDILSEGAPYAIRISAHAEPCAQPLRAPRRGCMPHAYATAFTRLVSP